MIHVFKTSVATKEDVLKIMQTLDDLLLPGEWNFDLDDCDNILRVDSYTVQASLVIKLMQENSFDCDELH